VNKAGNRKPVTNFPAAWQRLLEQASACDGHDMAPARAVRERGRRLLAAAFHADVAIETLVAARAALVDRLLIGTWHRRVDAADACLVAVGGYGRGELLPHSDVDLLVLYRDGCLARLGPALEGFVTHLWDIGLQIGHSVRTPRECVAQAGADVTVMTNLLEARPLAGDTTLFNAVETATAAAQIWPTAQYFRAKLQEQNERHARYDETAYKLEPDIKESPGGLRDLQTVAWVAKRQFATRTLDGLVEQGFLSAREFRELQQGRAFLWRVRCALHLLTDRPENRLLFDHQLQVADLFGYTDQDNNLAVEQFMQKYYRNIKALSALNDILLQLFSEAILHADSARRETRLNDRFQARHGYIGVTRDTLFSEQPCALLEIFHQLQHHPELTGIQAHTLRLMRRDRHLIDTHVRATPRGRQLFLAILCHDAGVTQALRRMNRYGILGRYLPAFGRIIGRMQYDLFHILTVDEHTLFVVRNLRRLQQPRFDRELPLASGLMQRLERPHVLYIAALMHDIAKGRGGDHAELGVADARAFCREHGLDDADTELVCWLVRRHLLMSMTAQRRDINDPDVIHEFAREVADHARLERLFILTVCDIRATNPNLWNSWKESLLTSLYHGTRRALARGLDDPIEEDELVAETRRRAVRRLQRAGFASAQFASLWARMDTEYFLRHSSEEIARQTRAIIEHQDNGPLVSLVHIADQGDTLFLHARDRPYLFGITTGVLAQAGLSVLDARINSTRDDYTLDTYIIREATGQAIAGTYRRREIERALRDAITDPDVVQINVMRRVSRQARHFDVPTRIRITTQPQGENTRVAISTADRPGLLCMIGEVFRAQGVVIETAKIATIGERAEDIFQITDQAGHPLRDTALRTALHEALQATLERNQSN